MNGKKWLIFVIGLIFLSSPFFIFAQTDSTQEAKYPYIVAFQAGGGNKIAFPGGQRDIPFEIIINDADECFLNNQEISCNTEEEGEAIIPLSCTPDGMQLIYLKACKGDNCIQGYAYGDPTGFNDDEGGGVCYQKITKLKKMKLGRKDQCELADFEAEIIEDGSILDLADYEGAVVRYKTTQAIQGDFGGRDGGESMCMELKPKGLECKPDTMEVHINVNKGDYIERKEEREALEESHADKNVYFYHPEDDKYIVLSFTPLGMEDMVKENYWLGSIGRSICDEGDVEELGLYACRSWTDVNGHGDLGEPQNGWFSRKNYPADHPGSPCSEKHPLVCSCETGPIASDKKVPFDEVFDTLEMPPSLNRLSINFKSQDDGTVSQGRYLHVDEPNGNPEQTVTICNTGVYGGDDVTCSWAGQEIPCNNCAEFDIDISQDYFIGEFSATNKYGTTKAYYEYICACSTSVLGLNCFFADEIAERDLPDPWPCEGKVCPRANAAENHCVTQPLPAEDGTCADNFHHYDNPYCMPCDNKCSNDLYKEGAYGSFIKNPNPILKSVGDMYCSMGGDTIMKCVADEDANTGCVKQVVEKECGTSMDNTVCLSSLGGATCGEKPEENASEPEAH